VRRASRPEGTPIPSLALSKRVLTISDNAANSNKGSSPFIGDAYEESWRTQCS
jgi:hypothetical protein